MASVICSHSLKKGVVTVRRIELVVLDVFAKPARAVAQRANHAGGKEPVRADPDEQDLDFDAT